jgi:hypothetical protein
LARRLLGQFQFGLRGLHATTAGDPVRPLGDDVDGVQMSVALGDFGKYVRRPRLSDRAGGND